MLNEVIVMTDEYLGGLEIVRISLEITKEEWKELSKRPEWKTVEALVTKEQEIEMIVSETEEQKNENSIYEDMVERLSDFVIRTANKDNPTSAEMSAMVEIAKMLFRTV